MRMRISKVLLLVFLVIAAAAFAQNLTQVVTQPVSSGLEILSNWRLLAVLAIIISVIFVAIGYAIGIGFEMPEMEAWARSELTQVFANVIIIIALIGIVAFIDFSTMLMVNGSGIGGLNCNAGENCLNKTVNAYLGDYLDAAEAGAMNTLENNLEASAWANRRIGLYCYVIYCAQLGLTTTIAPEYILDSDRYGIIFEYYTGLLSSLHAQSFFINEICFKVGPLILALGIVARAFFFSRKTGGLLIAIAAGMMFFFPAMYIFDWMTLDMTLTGDNGVQDQLSSCPTECGYSTPLAYYYNSSLGRNVGLTNTSAIYALFDEDESSKARELVLGNKSEATGKDGIIVYSCQINSSKSWFSSKYAISGANDTCDRTCRELPYPTGSSMCNQYSMQLACSAIPEACKVKRIVAEIDTTEQAKCPKECRMVPPMKSDCNVESDGITAGGYCLKSRFDCRVAMLSNLSWRPSIDSGLKGAEKCNTYPKDCVASLTANDSCTWVMPEFGSCDDLCAGCPEECRFLDENDLKNPEVSQCFYGYNSSYKGEYLAECKSCPSACKMNISTIDAVAPKDSTNCSSCPKTYRLLPAFQVLPSDYTTDTSVYNCSLTSCPKEYRANVTRSACEACADVEEKYTYDPPINFDCADLCKPPDNSPSKSSGDYTKIGEEGLVGREEIKSVSKLMIPGYLLPLFNITATIVVIRALSGMLGGDLEIPGLGKIF